MTTTENDDSQKWYKFLLDKNEMKVIINLLGQRSLTLTNLLFDVCPRFKNSTLPKILDFVQNLKKIFH